MNESNQNEAELPAAESCMPDEDDEDGEVRFWNYIDIYIVDRLIVFNCKLFFLETQWESSLDLVNYYRGKPKLN